jgi:hypothetical protein
MPKRTDIKRIGKRDLSAVLIWAVVPFVMIAIASRRSVEVQANTCVAGPPARISGALCGRVIDVAGDIETDGELRVVDQGGSVVGRTSVNSKGDFKLPPLAEGSYRLTTTAMGFREYVGALEIMAPGQTSCRKPVTVVLGFTSCTGGINDKDRPRHFHEPGW